MSRNLERVREVARSTLSRASTISAEERQMALTEKDFINIKEKMNKINQKLMVYIKIGKQSIKKLSQQNNVKKFKNFMNHMS